MACWSKLGNAVQSRHYLKRSVGEKNINKDRVFGGKMDQVSAVCRLSSHWERAKETLAYSASSGFPIILSQVKLLRSVNNVRDLKIGRSVTFVIK